MGSCRSKFILPDERPAQELRPGEFERFIEQWRNEEIEREQQEANRTREMTHKLLLLGTGESGKTTIFKQMRILHGSPKTDDELRMYGVHIRSNIITAIRKLCELTRELDLVSSLSEESAELVTDDSSDCSFMSALTNFDDRDLTPREAYDQIVSHLVDCTVDEVFPAIPDDWVGESSRAGIQANKDARQFLQHAEAIRVLWQSATIQFVWIQRAQANINDSHNEYLSDLTRIASPTYIPTDRDILLSRVRTTQVTKERYAVEGHTLEIYDVGGQRPFRHRGFEFFDDMDAVIFVAALSEYDQVLAEARMQNRMVESLKFFRSVVKHEAFVNKPILLFLNKKDVFAEKIMYSNIADSPFFSNYDGPAMDFDYGVLYFIQKFEEHLEEKEFKDAFVHVTCATDTNNMNFVLNSVRSMLMAEAMEDIFYVE